MLRNLASCINDFVGGTRPQSCVSRTRSEARIRPVQDTNQMRCYALRQRSEPACVPPAHQHDLARSWPGHLANKVFCTVSEPRKRLNPTFLMKKWVECELGARSEFRLWCLGIAPARRQMLQKNGQHSVPRQPPSEGGLRELRGFGTAPFPGRLPGALRTGAKRHRRRRMTDNPATKP